MTLTHSIWYQVKRIRLTSMPNEIWEGAIFPWDFKTGRYRLQTLEGKVVDFREEELVEVLPAECSDDVLRLWHQWLARKEHINDQQQLIEREKQELTLIEAQELKIWERLTRCHELAPLQTVAQDLFQQLGLPASTPHQVTDKGLTFAFQQFEVTLGTLQTPVINASCQLSHISLTRRWTVHANPTCQTFEFVTPTGELAPNYRKFTMAQTLLSQLQQVTGCWATEADGVSEEWKLERYQQALVGVHQVTYHQSPLPLTHETLQLLTPWLQQLN